MPTCSPWQQLQHRAGKSFIAVEAAIMCSNGHPALGTVSAHWWLFVAEFDETTVTKDLLISWNFKQFTNHLKSYKNHGLASIWYHNRSWQWPERRNVDGPHVLNTGTAAVGALSWCRVSEVAVLLLKQTESMQLRSRGSSGRARQQEVWLFTTYWRKIYEIQLLYWRNFQTK